MILYHNIILYHFVVCTCAETGPLNISSASSGITMIRRAVSQNVWATSSFVIATSLDKSILPKPTACGSMQSWTESTEPALGPGIFICFLLQGCQAKPFCVADDDLIQSLVELCRASRGSAIARKDTLALMWCGSLTASGFWVVFDSHFMCPFQAILQAGLSWVYRGLWASILSRTFSGDFCCNDVASVVGDRLHELIGGVTWWEAAALLVVAEETQLP